jgi:hypothetical protein
MGRTSASSLWFVSLMLVSNTVVFASGSAPLPKRLGQRDLANPEVISAWLKAHGATADRELAARFFDRAQIDEGPGAPRERDSPRARSSTRRQRPWRNTPTLRLAPWATRVPESSRFRRIGALTWSTSYRSIARR